MEIISNKHIAIVGGGPGGLTLARLLQRNGATVTVFERDQNEHVRVQGATLDLHEESGLAALEQAGLMMAFKKNYRPDAGKLRIMDKRANIEMDFHLVEHYEETRPEIDRGPLRRILLDSLIPGTVVWDSHFVSMQAEGDSWLLSFKNGKQERADMVIAADGANSKIRPFITPVKPFFAGITAVEGAVHDSEINAPKIHQLLKGGKIFAFGDKKSLVVSSKGDGSFAFYTSCRTEEKWIEKIGLDFHDKGQVVQWAKREFAGWGEVWFEMFENADPHFIARPQYCMPPGQVWQSRSNLTMLGDAAHLMPPYAGEGVNMAMLDALQLAECLTNKEFPTLLSAIAHYEHTMLARAADAVKMTLDSTEMMHSQDPITSLREMFGNFKMYKAKEPVV